MVWLVGDSKSPSIIGHESGRTNLLPTSKTVAKYKYGRWESEEFL